MILRRSAATLFVCCLVAVAACASPGSRSESTASSVPTGPPASDLTTSDAGAAALDPGATGTTVDAGTLPQTRDRPSNTSAAFLAGQDALWRAVVADDPDQAMAFFFPLSAYRQVKAVADPASDWQHRLVAAFRRDIHSLHQRVGAGAADATFVGLQVPDGAARWIEPGQEVNKLGYWRVYGSALRYRQGGVDHDLPIYSLISWRGEWYVVHVSHP